VIHPSKERISVAMFQYPRSDLMLGPLPEFVKEPAAKARYGTASYQEFMAQYFGAKLDGRGHIERFKLE
jgi:isopenicillin N synthase-like dioxygenase